MPGDGKNVVRQKLYIPKDVYKRQGETPVLVATDIAARGIDVKDVRLVINYDLPEEPEVDVYKRQVLHGQPGIHPPGRAGY